MGLKELLLLINYKRIANFFVENNILTSSIAIIISQEIIEISNKIIETLIIPIFNKDSNKDGVKDFKKLEDTTLEIYGVKFEIGNLTIKLLKTIFILMFILMLCIIYFQINGLTTTTLS